MAESPRPAFLVDAEGTIRAWNTNATGFFGIPAWEASAHCCAGVIRGAECSQGCPLLVGGGQLAVAVMDFDLVHVPSAAVRHTPVHDRAGRLVGMIHEIGPSTTLAAD